MDRLLIVALLTAVIAGCATSTSSNVYSRYSIQQAWMVEYGKVADLKAVKIEGERSDYGVLAGSLIGAALGTTVGAGSGVNVAAAAGAVAGGIAGQAAEEKITRANGVQITIRMDGGQDVAIVQGADEKFQVGERVKVLRAADGTARVTKI